MELGNAGATQPRSEQLSHEPPLFILGIWRSGTTHLHNLLARDARLAAPTSYEMLFPHTFLTTMGFNASFVDWMIPDKRVQDNVKMGMHEPQEDEFALNCLTQISPLLGWAFPRRAGTMTGSSRCGIASLRKSIVGRPRCTGSCKS